jgi:transcriptional regulator with XRE-family HTH domain
MTALARETGLGRDTLYKALSGEANPSFGTILKVTRALGLNLTVEHANAHGCLPSSGIRCSHGLPPSRDAKKSQCDSRTPSGA